MKRYAVLLYLIIICITAVAQSPVYGKMSSLIRQLVRVEERQRQMAAFPQQSVGERSVCAFVKIDGDAEAVLSAVGATFIAQIGAVTIADIPICQLSALSQQREVVRIEAKERQSLTMDTSASTVHASDVYAGTQLPQAYTGKGVLVGVQDVGFDLTHPTYFSKASGTYRVKTLWDQLAQKEPGSTLYVGRTISGEEALRTYGHSADGLIETHGTHTSGTAAGSGGETSYRGIAWESDIALVANAVNTNISLVPEEERDHYTYTTDVLGFKYLFDYATDQGQPCVVSFSEGSLMDFRGDDQLYFESLSSLVGAGKILVASAGNSGWDLMMHKDAGQSSVQARITSKEKRGYFTIRATDAFTLELFRADQPDEHLVVTSADVLAATDQTLAVSLTVNDVMYPIEIAAYTSCYDASEMIYDIDITCSQQLGADPLVMMKVSGENAAVDVYPVLGNFYYSNDGSTRYASTVFSPGAAPDVICVGSTAYKTEFTNVDGQTIQADYGSEGAVASFSGIGPSFDGRVKPEVVAPGVHIAASYSKAYFDQCTDENELRLIVERDAQGYPWGVSTGTSMSTPIVAGIIALWLEADPTLTPDDIRDVFLRTCYKKEPLLSYPNNKWGYGEINAYEGMLDILHLTGIKGLSHEQPSALTIRPTGNGQLEILLPEAIRQPLVVKLFSLDGQLIDQHTLPPSDDTRRLIHLATTSNFQSSTFSPQRSRIFAVQVNGPTAATTGSTLIRMAQ